MITYIIKVILCSAIFMLTYKLLLEKEKMHQFNRFYLLFSLLLSFIIPTTTFTSSPHIIPASTYEYFNSTLIQDQDIPVISLTGGSTDYTFPILLTVYLLITSLLFFRFIGNLYKILLKTGKHNIIPYKKSKIVLIKEDLAPHSFLNFIFINTKEYKKGNIEDEILIHEYAHIRQKHSYDILLVEALQIFFWFNPVLFLYRKAMQLNHEFLADKAVIKYCENIPKYQNLLIDKANNRTTYKLTSQLNYLTTKKRLIMMTKNKSPKSVLLRQFAIIPVLALSIFIFSTKTFSQDTESTTNQKNTPSTQEGVSQELLNEYEQIVNKAKVENGQPNFFNFSDVDKQRLQNIYLAMSEDQQAQQIVTFTRVPGGPFAKVVPTEQQIESWKDPQIYGLWIDGQRVSNSVLNSYKNTDFAHLFVSKLMKNAKNYEKHKYQVDLMTIEGYEAHLKKAMKNKDKYLMGIQAKN